MISLGIHPYSTQTEPWLKARELIFGRVSCSSWRLIYSP